MLLPATADRVTDRRTNRGRPPGAPTRDRLPESTRLVGVRGPAVEGSKGLPALGALVIVPAVAGAGGRAGRTRQRPRRTAEARVCPPQCCSARLAGGLRPRASAARRFAADSEQRRAACRAVALPPGPTVRQGHLARVGDGDLLAADAPALRAGLLYLVDVRLNHVRQAYFVATCLSCGAHHRWAAAPATEGARPPLRHSASRRMR